jgi:hypothetical protein
MSALADFAAVRLDGWPGLPAGLGTADAAFLGADPARALPGLIGDPPRAGRWLPCVSSVYRGGLRVWVDGDRITLIEGDNPVDEAGEPMPAPDLGEPEARLDTVLDTLVLDGGELVHAARGLAVRVNPGNGLLLGVRGFVPRSVDDYVTLLRPQLAPRRHRSGVAR